MKINYNLIFWPRNLFLRHDDVNWSFFLLYVHVCMPMCAFTSLCTFITNSICFCIIKIFTQFYRSSPEKKITKIIEENSYLKILFSSFFFLNFYFLSKQASNFIQRFSHNKLKKKKFQKNIQKRRFVFFFSKKK